MDLNNLNDISLTRRRGNLHTQRHLSAIASCRDKPGEIGIPFRQAKQGHGKGLLLHICFHHRLNTIWCARGEPFVQIISILQLICGQYSKLSQNFTGHDKQHIPSHLFI